MQETTGFFAGQDGVRLFYRLWSSPAASGQNTAEKKEGPVSASEPRGSDLPATKTIVLVHGSGEHSGRYNHWAARLVEAGYRVAAPDLRGLGQSGGLKGHVNAFSDYLADLRAFLEKLRAMVAEYTIPNVPQPTRYFLYGHSLGGLIALGYALNYPENLAGVIVSSPALGLAMKVSPIKTGLGQLASRYLPTLRLDSGIPSHYLSRNPEIGRAYDRDPFVYRKVSARWYTEFVGAMEEYTRRAGELHLPILFLQAGADHLVSPSATENFFRLCGSADKTYKVYPEAFHELHNDLVAEEVFHDLLQWLRNRS